MTVTTTPCPGCGRLLQVQWHDGVAVPFINLANCVCRLTADHIEAITAALQEQRTPTPQQETLCIDC